MNLLLKETINTWLCIVCVYSCTNFLIDLMLEVSIDYKCYIYMCVCCMFQSSPYSPDQGLANSAGSIHSQQTINATAAMIQNIQNQGALQQQQHPVVTLVTPLSTTISRPEYCRNKTFNCLHNSGVFLNQFDANFYLHCFSGIIC